MKSTLERSARTAGVSFACDCGRTKELQAHNVTRGTTVSCGCRGRVTRDQTRHGHARTGGSPTYKTWACMVARCVTTTNPDFHRYGARGIKVCERWLGPDGFKNFLADMGERPPGMTLDRINNNDGYDLANCRWASRTEQARNRRSTKLTAEDAVEIRERRARGETLPSIAAEFAVSLGCVDAVVRRATWRDVP